MKSIWTLVSILAVAHLLALGGFAGWLVGTGRLDGDRLERIREILAEDPGAGDEAEGDAENEADDDASLQTVALSTDDRIDLLMEGSQINRQRKERLRREMQDLQRSHQREQDRLDQERQAFEAERASFRAELERLQEIDGGAQFRKSVKVLESLRAGEAMQTLLAVIDGAVIVDEGAAVAPEGASVREDGMRRAVSYLNAMQERARSKVMGEFVKQQPDLAAELLERLRTRGLTARVPETPDG